ncbi:MAG: fibronectin type III domain-containing protein [Saprospiraceae bacterium]|nr:fibronectin type III domain-containing protein [Saprospiraceae bacterium]
MTALFFCGTLFSADAATDRYRCMWRDDPSTTMVIGWDQVSGTTPTVLYDVVDNGQKAALYKSSVKPTFSISSKGMKNHFARLTGLKPNTVYYFIIKDSEGVSKRFSFQTAPADPNSRISIIAGGDSRNHREARRDANRLVSKLRPHVILFNGDMTGGDTAPEWREWFDDWQLTIGSDGRLFPLIVARGNHEASNQPLIDLFDVKQPDVYYALNIGGNLIRVYTLNSMIPAGGAQREWLENDLKTVGTQATWRIAQYHHAIRPHHADKTEKDELLLNWATFFHKYRLHLAIESDSHVTKATWPVRPSRESGSDEGFIRDDENGTIYVGEGGWGAPLRENNDDKSWTRNSDSFNHFNWIFVDGQKMEIRTIKTDGSNKVQEVDHKNIFNAPVGLVVWTPSNGDVITVRNTKPAQVAAATMPPSSGTIPAPGGDVLASKQGGHSVSGFSIGKRESDVAIRWTGRNEPDAITYEIHRSLDGGKQFKLLASVPGKGKVEKQDYAHLDKGFAVNSQFKNALYRIKAIRKDGQFSFFSPDPPAPDPAQAQAQVQADPSKKPKEEVPDKPKEEDNKLIPDPATGAVRIKYNLAKTSNVLVLLTDAQNKEISKVPLNNQPPGAYNKSLDLSRIGKGKYTLVIKAEGSVVAQYQVEKG